MEVRIKRNNIINDIILYLFFTLVVGLFLFGKAFSYINFKFIGLPVYITELFLIFTIIFIFVNSIFLRDGKLFINYNQRVEFLLFYIIFIISLVRGLISYRDIVFTLRQSAIIYYSIFYFLVPIILDNFKKIKIYFSFLVICTSILVLVILFGVNIGELGGFYYYYYVSMSLIFLIFYPLLIKKPVLKFFSYSLILVHLAIILLSKVRAAWIGILMGILFIIYMFFRIPVMRKDLKKILLLGMLGFLVLAIILPVFLIFYPSSIEDIKNEFMSIYNFRDMTTVSAANARWRLMAWSDYVNKSLEKPLFGHGFGKVFMPETLVKEIDWSPPKGEDWVDPHNSYLSILFRTGVIGLIIFFIIIFRFFKLSIKFIKECDNERIRIYVASLLTIIIVILGISFFDVVLERPFFGIFLWINMGLVISLIKIKKKQTK